MQYLLNNKGRSVCGRVRQDQIDAYHEFVEVCIWRSLKTKRSSNLAFYLIAVSGISISGCGTSEPQEQHDQSFIGGDTALLEAAQNLAEADGDTTTQPQRTERKSDTPVDFTAVVGDLILDDTTTYHGTHAHSLPDIMPEFPGGQDSLFAFMREHMTYPAWESEHKIEGKVYVEFVVDKSGMVKEAVIKRSVKESRNLDAEVLRVINMMPSWSPGMNGEQAVSTKMVLPVVFKL
ncbi:MAG: energy transducer TonB [Flavobacteriales bacterium]|nr:energy transducer TonB [Flavobacteriales bacterium]MBK6752600.1 energy transducer TonB [Flavobacteriales bacterium]MBK7268517.1 energy transducer TonB [Flavobacteriales bacterium]MBK9537170.1 energy transducer TonB [Flavobacteriales bacterium]